MPILFCLNILIFVATPILWPYLLGRYFRLGLINPLTIMVLVGMPLTIIVTFSGPFLFLDDGLFNPYFQYALLVTNVYSIVTFSVGMGTVVLLDRTRLIPRLMARYRLNRATANPDRMLFAAKVFFGMAVVAFLLLAQSSFGIVNWLMNPREGYQLHRAGAGEWYAFSITFLSVSLALVAIYAPTTRAFLLRLPLYLGLTYLFASKAIITQEVTFILIALCIRRYRYFTVWFALLGTLGVGLVVDNLASTLESFKLESIAEYSDYYVNAAHYYEENLEGRMPLYDGTILFSSLWGLAPRALFPDKPYSYGMAIISDAFYPDASKNTNYPAFATVFWYADFGWFGVIGHAMLDYALYFGIIQIAVVLRNLKALNVENGIPHSRFITYLFVICFAPSFLLFFAFPINFVMMFVIFGLIEFIHRGQIRVT